VLNKRSADEDTVGRWSTEHTACNITCEISQRRIYQRIVSSLAAFVIFCAFVKCHIPVTWPSSMEIPNMDAEYEARTPKISVKWYGI